MLNDEHFEGAQLATRGEEDGLMAMRILFLLGDFGSLPNALGPFRREGEGFVLLMDLVKDLDGLLCAVSLFVYHY